MRAAPAFRTGRPSVPEESPSLSPGRVTPEASTEPGATANNLLCDPGLNPRIVARHRRGRRGPSGEGESLRSPATNFRHPPALLSPPPPPHPCPGGGSAGLGRVVSPELEDWVEL